MGGNVGIMGNTEVVGALRFQYVYTVNYVLLIPLLYRCLKNVIHQIDSKNEWLLLSVTFMAKLELVFVLTFQNAFSQSFHFKDNRKSIVSSKKNGTRDFQNSLPFERSACFHVTIIESFKLFNTLTLKQIFWKKKPFSKNWNTILQLKIIRLKAHHSHSKLLCQEPMLTQIKWRLQNGPFTKSGVLPVTTLFFWKICSSLRTS